MSLLKSRTQSGPTAADWPAEVRTVLHAARRVLSWRRILFLAATTFVLPVAFAAIWIGVLRFTLLDLPRWPVAIVILLWAVTVAMAAARTAVSTSEAALYADKRLGLDERLTTTVELILRSRGSWQSAGLTPLERGLILDTAAQLNDATVQLPHPFKLRGSTGHAALLGAAVTVLIATILIPSSLDAVRAERAALRAELNKEIAAIVELRAELVTRPGLPDEMRQSLFDELTRLKSTLEVSDLNREAMLAAIADTQEKLRAQMPASLSDFSGSIAAAQIVQEGARLNSEWSPGDIDGVSPLIGAADASEFLAGVASSFSNVQSRSVGLAYERAGSFAASNEQMLSQNLSAVATALGLRDTEVAESQMLEAARRFRSSERERNVAETVERALSTLDDGRQSLARAGKPEQTRAQVGFRRPGPKQGTPSEARNANGSTQQDAEGTPSAPNQEGTEGANQDPGLGPRIGQNSPAFGASRTGTPSASGAPSQGGPQAPGGAQPSGGGQGIQPAEGGTNSGSTSAGGSQQGDGQGASTGQQGNVQGPITGPVGRPGGTSSQAGGAAGTGSGTAGVPPGTGSSDDEVYTGAAGASQEVEGNTSEIPPEGQSGGGGITGRAGDGESGSSRPGAAGAGVLAPIRTPYKEVIGEYAERASRSLDRVYIPADAKDYVKQYFTELGK